MIRNHAHHLKWSLRQRRWGAGDGCWKPCELMLLKRRGLEWWSSEFCQSEDSGPIISGGHIYSLGGLTTGNLSLGRHTAAKVWCQDVRLSRVGSTPNLLWGDFPEKSDQAWLIKAHDLYVSMNGSDISISWVLHCFFMMICLNPNWHGFLDFAMYFKSHSAIAKL